MSSLSPQITYYFGLYIVVVLSRFFRVYFTQNGKYSTELPKNYWYEYLYVGLDMVFVATGVFVYLISDKSSDYVNTYLIGVVILVLLGTFLELVKENNKLKLYGNIILGCLIFLVTIISFPKPQRPLSENMNSPYKVAIPYKDRSFSLNSPEQDGVILFYRTDIQAVDREDAINKAIDKFYSQSGPTAYVKKFKDSKNILDLIERDIVVERKDIQKSSVLHPDHLLI